MERSVEKFVFVLIIFFCVECFALTNEIGNTSAPASTGRSGLIKSPNPMAPIGGNLTVTGNVTGLSYFHGNIPYSSPTNFQGPLGSTSLDSFLRLTAPVTSPTTPRYLPQPYYSPTGSVTSLAPSALGVALTYPTIKSSGGTGEYIAPPIPKVDTQKVQISAASPLYDYSRTRPLSYEPTDLERATSLEKMREENKKKLSEALQRASRGLGEEKQPEKEPENPIIFQPAKPAEAAKSFEPITPLRPDEKPIVEAQKPVKDIYEQILEAQKPSGQPPAKEEKEAEKPEEEAPSEKGKLGEIEKETAKATVEIHKSFATEAKTKFNYYMRTAEGLLKQGKYYSAVDAYTLASIYKPDDPLAYAGRAHALFASGEYISSAYFLARAINIFPGYVNVKVDLRAMIPDANRLDSRIEDIKVWIERTESPELYFLLAYIYYQLDENNLAAEAIKFSEEKLPNVAAVKALKQAIEKKSR